MEGSYADMNLAPRLSPNCLTLVLVNFYHLHASFHLQLIMVFVHFLSPSANEIVPAKKVRTLVRLQNNQRH